MFGFLKNKLKASLNIFKKPAKTQAPKKSLKQRIISKITEKTLTEDRFNEFFQGLELNLLESNIAYDTIQAIKANLKKDLIGKLLKRVSIESIIKQSLINAIDSVIVQGDFKPVLEKLNQGLTVFMFVGTNGSGKTTSIAKFANFLMSKKYTVVLAACDTFRAASIEQLEKHAQALGVKVVKHTYGSDPAAVAFDAVAHAKAKGINAVLIDTAGRSHANTNLMNELGKVKRVVNPDYLVFVGDALTGNDVVEQCKTFNEVTPFNFAILTKTDVDEKGGAIISVSHATGVPIMFIGTGQTYNDFKLFNKKELIKQIFS